MYNIGLMRKLQLLLATFVITCYFALFTPLVAADNGVRLVRDGNTYYLSTEEDGNATDSEGRTYRLVQVDENPDNDPDTTATPSTTSTVLRGDVVPPVGYTTSIGNLINFILRVTVIVALLLILLSLITAGFEWITSGGDKGKTEGARNRIIAAFVGIIILSAAYALTVLVAYILGFDSFMEIFTSIRRINPK
jgi:hypothetical protein